MKTKALEFKGKRFFRFEKLAQAIEACLDRNFSDGERDYAQTFVIHYLLEGLESETPEFTDMRNAIYRCLMNRNEA